MNAKPKQWAKVYDDLADQIPYAVDTNLDGELKCVIFTDENDNEIGFIDFMITDDTPPCLEILWLETPLRGKGVADALFAYVLDLYPEIQSISSKLSGANLSAFQRALQSATPQEAIRRTYAFKRWEKFGFTTVDLERSSINEEAKSVLLVMKQG